MKFIDLVKLQVKAGKGGNGIVAFHRELYVAKGGPSGGDGGNGGSIIFVGDSGVNTLLDLRKHKIIHAEPGENGKPKKMSGKRGNNTYIKVPLGTIIKNAANGNIIGDITKNNEEVLVAGGGVGGRGNAKFASAVNRVPKISENGALGEEFEIVCELKLLADAGLIGLPNAGKSTFVNAVSKAKPQIADYPFTTLTPQLGLISVNNNNFVIADLPGLIAGASDGKGLGLQFLKHIERCLVLVHLIDISDINVNHYETYQLIRNELGKYNANLLNKPELIIANKVDLLTDLTIINKLQKKLKKTVYAISALNKQNLENVLKIISETINKERSQLEELPASQKEHVTYQYVSKKTIDTSFQINKARSNKWEVTGPALAKISQKNPLNTYQNRLLYEIQLKDLGVYDKLRASGVEPGDEIQIYNYSFIWQ